MHKPEMRLKFEWVNSEEYRQDRRARRFSCKGKWDARAESAFSFLAAYVKDQGLILSPEDLKVLAAGFTRGIPVVSDDKGVRQVADVHAIECWGTLCLLKLMVDCNRIDMAKVREVLQYLDHENDLPMGKTALRERYKELFGGVCPL